MEQIRVLGIRQLNIWLKKCGADPVLGVSGVMNTRRSNYWYQQLGDSCRCSLTTHSISPKKKPRSGLLFFRRPSLLPTSRLTFAARGLIVLCLPWQGRDLVQLEEHNELDASKQVSWESSAPDSVELRHTRLGWLVQAVHFWLVWATKLKCASLCRWSTNLTCCRKFLCLVTLTLINSAAFPHSQIISHVRNIHWLMPTTLRPFFVIMALRLREGPLISLMSHKRRRIIHSSSLDIGWYFNIWPLTLGVYLPTELARAQMPSDVHLHK